MMIVSPQQKADEIFNKFYSITCSQLDAKECCLYFVEEMIEESKQSLASVINWKDVKEIIEKK